MSLAATPKHGYGPNGKPIWALNEAGKPICGAGQKVCKSTIRMASGRCRVHGGASTGRPPSDKAPDQLHPSTLLRREKVLRALGMAQSAQAVRHDPALLEHRENIILFEGFIESTAEGMRPTPEIWEQARSLWQQAASGNHQALIDLGALLVEGLDGAAREARILDLVDRQKKHIEAENKRESQLAQNLSATQANYLRSQYIQLLKEAILNQDIPRERIPLEVAKGLSRFYGTESDSGSRSPGAGALN